MRLPCPTCFQDLEERTTRKEKPYFVCESCGVQIFIRFQKGIERLSKAASLRKLVLDDWIICRTCQIAVKKTKKKIQHFVIGRDGIYCPLCEGFLLAASQVTE